MSSNNELLNTPGDLLNTSIPILMCDKVISVRKWYVVRLTPDIESDYALGDIKELIQEITLGDWVVCTELSAKKKLHYHLVISSIFDLEDVKKDFTGFLRDKYPNKWGKADGNKRMNFQESTDVNQAIKYCVKQKVISYGDNINPKYIEWAKKVSFEKYSKEAFTLEMEAIKTEFKEDKIDHKQLRTKIIQLKGKFSQPINSMRITDMVNSLRVQKDPSFATEL